MKDRICSFYQENKFDALAFSFSTASIPLQQIAERTVSPAWLTTRFHYDLVYNSGDFAEAIIFGSLADVAIKKIYPNARRSHQLFGAALTSVGGILLMESVQFPRPISYMTGVADPKDIASGLVGAAFYYGLARFLDRGPGQRRRAI